MPKASDVPLKELTYANGERQSLLTGGSTKSLLRLYDDKQLEDFQAKLRTPSGRGQDFLDVLDVALRDTDSARADFLDALLKEVDALGDVADPRRDNRTPLITAADAGNHRALRLLLHVDARPESRVRRLEAKDRFGSTALHASVVAAVDNATDARLECVAWLLDRHRACEVDFRGQDQRGRTALYLAAKGDNVALVRAFLEHEHIGLDIVHEVKGDTPRTLILQRLPELAAELATRPHDADMTLGDELRRLLERDDADSQKAFCAKVAESAADARGLRHSCGDMSLTQLACLTGRHDAVDALLAKAPALAATPADAVNRTPPLLLAAAHAHLEVIQVFRRRAQRQFQERSLDGDTVLISLVRHWDDASPRYPACLELLLSSDYRDLVDVNATHPGSGDGALHLAALCRLTAASAALLGAGACLAGVNKRGVAPVDHLSAATLETHLDACVENVGNVGSDEREIVFDYACLRAPPPRVVVSRKSASPTDAESQRAAEAPRREMETLVAVSRSKELRRLLKHPVLNSFLDHKWEQMHSIFYVNAILYVLFVIFITWHILDAGRKPDSEDGLLEPTPGVFMLATAGFTYLLLREVAQLLIGPWRYVREAENALEVTLLVCAGAVLARWPFEAGPQQRVAAALTVLLAWGELVLLLGRHPRFATYVEMLKTVTWNFLKFLFWFAGLIIAFSLCFFTLFRDEPSAEAFRNLPLSSFKTLVMMTGELDIDGVPLDGLPFISRPIFVVYVFLVVIVLLNLLNGLAVSDTQAIKDDAELVCCVSRVSMAERVESKLFDWLHLTQLVCPCLTPLAARMIRAAAVVRTQSAPPEGRLLPNADRVLHVGLPRDIAPPSAFCCLLGRLGASGCCKVSRKIVKRAEAVIAARGAGSELRDLEERLLRRIDEVSREMEARLARRVEDVGREVASAIRAALDERTTQL